MPKTADTALRLLEQRWTDIFERLAGGGEVPPSQRLRAEGFMEALVALECAAPEMLQARMAARYKACFGESLPDGWEDLFPFPQVPGFGERAPVVPTTAD